MRSPRVRQRQVRLREPQQGQRQVQEPQQGQRQVQQRLQQVRLRGQQRLQQVRLRVRMQRSVLRLSWFLLFLDHYVIFLGAVLVYAANQEESDVPLTFEKRHRIVRPKRTAEDSRFFQQPPHYAAARHCSHQPLEVLDLLLLPLTSLLSFGGLRLLSGEHIGGVEILHCS
jgi:hypothetical protein